MTMETPATSPKSDSLEAPSLPLLESLSKIQLRLAKRINSVALARVVRVI